MQQDTDVIVEWIDKELVLETQHRQSPIAATYLDVDGNALFWLENRSETFTQFSPIKDGIYVLRKAPVCAPPCLSPVLPAFALETVPVLVWSAVVLSCLFLEGC